MKPRRELLDYGCGREACERCQGREISYRMKAPPKGSIVFGPLRRLPLGQPTEPRVDRFGDSNGRHHHEHNKSKPGPREATSGAASLQGEYCRGGSGNHAEDWHHGIHPKQRPPEINRVLLDWHSPPEIGSLDSENQNSAGPEATGDEHNPGADLCNCHALHLHLALGAIGLDSYAIGVTNFFPPPRWLGRVDGFSQV
jgi:hypothetical protein